MGFFAGFLCGFLWVFMGFYGFFSKYYTIRGNFWGNDPTPHKTKLGTERVGETAAGSCLHDVAGSWRTVTLC